MYMPSAAESALKTKLYCPSELVICEFSPPLSSSQSLLTNSPLYKSVTVAPETGWRVVAS